jgi:hypothetical protein
MFCVAYMWLATVVVVPALHPLDGGALHLSLVHCQNKYHMRMWACRSCSPHVGYGHGRVSVARVQQVGGVACGPLGLGATNGCC